MISSVANSKTRRSQCVLRKSYQISLFHSRVVAVILKFGNYRVRDLCTPPELFEGIFTVKTEKV